MNVATVESPTTNAASASMTVQAHKMTPTVTAGSDQTVLLGREIVLSAAVNDPGSDVQSATVDWGDGVGV